MNEIASSPGGIVFTEDDILNNLNRCAEFFDRRVLPRYGKGEKFRTGKCSRCGSPCWPYAMCAKHRGTRSLMRILKNLERQGEVLRVTDGRGKKGGSVWRIKPKTPYVRSESKIGRNDPCKCGSGAKYKKCCLVKVQGK